MSQAYSDPKRAADPFALPDVEVFYVPRVPKNKAHLDRAVLLGGPDGPAKPGWYWWPCFPGCLPDGEPSGPFDTEAAALADAQANDDPDDDDADGAE